MEDLVVDKIVNNGVRLVDPNHAHELYEGLHSHSPTSRHLTSTESKSMPFM
jgi:hypothetical protein